MNDIDLHLWEPEETIGKLWHSFASGLSRTDTDESVCAFLEDVEGRLCLFFRGLGGPADVVIKPSPLSASQHRLSFQSKLATDAERIAHPSFDGETLRLPEKIDFFPEQTINATLYFWLTALAVFAPELADETDPLKADLQGLICVDKMIKATLAACPGFTHFYNALILMYKQQRHEKNLPSHEAAIETVILSMLGAPPPEERLAKTYFNIVTTHSSDLSIIQAPKGYRPFQPVLIWPALCRKERSETADTAYEETQEGTDDEGKKQYRARRRQSEQADRRDSFILHKFEGILSIADFLNLNKRVDDDDLDTAKKALDDMDELALGQVSKTTATKLKLHLDLAPEDVDMEKLSGEHLFPEWDARKGAYLPDHCRVLASDVEPIKNSFKQKDKAMNKRIRAVRRQFEALRPRRVVKPGQQDGDELDIEAVVRAQIDLLATGQGSSRVWIDHKSEARDLAVSILLDTSRSTQSAVNQSETVIDIACEALTALAWGLNACGDHFAIHGFSSLRRDRVFVRRCKGFSEPMGRQIEDRIANLKPGFYTRLGAAIRYVSADLSQQSQQRRLLLVITDGKPNDFDHYEGHHGIEDSRVAIVEARRMGHAVFGIAIDTNSQSWFPRIFGRGGFCVIPKPDRLITALPHIYRQLVAA